MTETKPSAQVISEILGRLIHEANRNDRTSFAALARTAGLDPATDFIGASLPDLDFRDEDLRGFDFSGADLSGADFRRANLAGVRLYGATLIGAIGLSHSHVALSNYPNVVPPNKHRLADVLTIKYGPTRLLTAIIREGDKAARRAGLQLYLRHDFAELVYLNKQEVSRGTWFRLPNMFDPNTSDVSPENSFWIAGEDEHGEIVATWAGRIYYWPETNLEQQACSMFYGYDGDHECKVTAEAAKLITGVVLHGGAAWINPDFRGAQLSKLIGTMGRAYAFARWPIDWSIAFVSRTNIEKGIAVGYGHRNFSYSIFFPGSPWGELEVVLAYTPTPDAYDELANFLTVELSHDKMDDPLTSESPMSSEHDKGIVRGP